MGYRVLQCAFQPAYEALINGSRLERPVAPDKLGEPFEKVCPEISDGFPNPILINIVAD